jgi:hypothetical protein
MRSVNLNAVETGPISAHRTRDKCFDRRFHLVGREHSRPCADVVGRKHRRRSDEGRR